MKRFVTVIFSMFAFGMIIQAQIAITSSGGDASGSGGSISYTAGQVAYSFNNGTNGSVAQGVQQPFEISVITGLEDTKDVYIIYSVYPNPADDFLTLKVENYSNENLSYQLFDNNGILLLRDKVTGNETIISMANLVPSIYILKVIDSKQEIKIFKIIKN